MKVIGNFAEWRPTVNFEVFSEYNDWKEGFDKVK